MLVIYNSSLKDFNEFVIIDLNELLSKSQMAILWLMECE